jgi:GNAT superfamily N-acetyltransferase
MIPFAPRPARDEDAQDLFGLLTLCFAEFPGCFIDPHDDLADLLRPAHAFAERKGHFWVVDDARGRVCACVALDHPEAGAAEMHRLYVRPDRRRTGLGQALVEHGERQARFGGAALLVLWSDTRFDAAHRLYERLGYVRTGHARELNDISRSTEHRFEKPL